MDGQGSNGTKQDQQQLTQKEIQHISSPTHSSNKLKISRTMLLVLTLGAVLILGVIVFLVLKGDKNLFELQRGLPKVQIEDALRSEYKNPFEKKDEYVNPFSSYQNPFENL